MIGTNPRKIGISSMISIGSRKIAIGQQMTIIITTTIVTMITTSDTIPTEGRIGDIPKIIAVIGNRGIVEDLLRTITVGIPHVQIIVDHLPTPSLGMITTKRSDTTCQLKKKLCGIALSLNRDSNTL
mgnify:CR=1 FL=1